MVIGEIALQQTTKVPRIQNHNMIQAFTANRADQPFREGIVPWTPGRSDHFFHRQGVDPPAKLDAIDRVTIPDQVPLGVTFRKRLGHLLTRPFRRRMLGDAKCRTRLRSCSMTRKTNNTRKRIVGTVKKSTATISPR